MRLRNRAVGAGETFYPFKRLPIELRNMIWCLTLQPRVVEMHWKPIQAEQDPDEANTLDPNDINHYYSRATLPTALQTCRDSRDAVLPFYPLCFASRTHEPKTRFNLSIDTLYLHCRFDWYEVPAGSELSPAKKRIFAFLESLTPIETTKLANIAISADSGYGVEAADWYGRKYWASLGELMGLFTGLENIFTVHDIADLLDMLCDYWEDLDNPRRAKSLALASSEYGVEDETDKADCVEFLDDVLAELLQSFGFTDFELEYFDFEQDSNRRGNGDWVDKITKPVWGCRRLKHPDPVP